jgi:hypothetical protein
MTTKKLDELQAPPQKTGHENQQGEYECPLNTGYEIIEWEGRPARRYPDGSIRDEHGYWLTAPPNGNRFDAETGLAANRKRWEAHREEAAAGLVRAVQEGKHIPSQVGSAKAWGSLVQHAAKTALGTSNVRGLAEIMRFLGEAVGALPGRGPTADQGEPVGQGELETEVLELIYREVKIRAARIRAERKLKGEDDGQRQI